jgi:hypothetical protein
MKRLLLVVLVCFPIALAHAQRVPKYRILPDNSNAQTEALFGARSPQPLTVRHSGHYTLSDWRRLVDSAWGPGLATDKKLEVFDAFWNKVDQTWGGFPNLSINWDSLKNVYRPIVAAGVSRGRFAGIMSRLTRALNEWHVFAFDKGIDAGMGLTGAESEYPNIQSYHYEPGVPILNLGNATILRSSFGAGITSLGDSLGLIYSVIPNHPLGLKPGDIVLGYHGISWRRLVQELLDAELPAFNGGTLGSTPAGRSHALTSCVGLNWGLFDTIDILKYPSGDTLHYPTSLLRSITPPYLLTTEQLPVDGVSFPQVEANEMVSWGVVSGTSIGYIYVWDWYGVPDGKTMTQFFQAVDELVGTQEVTGLILDFRTNLGGWENYANDGFKLLFNSDPTDNYGRAWRIVGNDHLAFRIDPAWGPDHFTPTAELFDHPIAVLTGPICGSAGDYNAFRMRFHPMVRFFGKPTAGAYTDLDEDPYFNSNGFECRVDPACVYSNVNNEAYMIHKAFPVDEEVWLTREGVAQGEDDVVKHALAWISGLAYAHDATVSRDTLMEPRDSVVVAATVENPNSHGVVVSAIVTNTQGAVVDSVLFAKGVGRAWRAYIKKPTTPGKYNISVRTEDTTADTFRRLPNVASFVVVTTDVRAEREELPKTFGLGQNYPNPFNPKTVVSCQLPVASRIRLVVYDLLGREVKVLMDEKKELGRYEVTWDASGCASGVYICRMTAGQYIQSRTMVLLK